VRVGTIVDMLTTVGKTNKAIGWRNRTPQRDVSAICYLNDEFDGGEICFEQAQLTVKPRRGLLLAFPSDAAHGP